MELQHINLKIFLKDDTKLDFSEFNPIFQKWIQEKVTEELLIDVADYLHVPGGPGIILIGLETDYSIDHTDNRWGLRYNRKELLEGSNQERLTEAFKTTLQTCKRLEENENLKGKLKFRFDEIELFINDRALAPNTEETFRTLQLELQEGFKRLLGDSDFSMKHQKDRLRQFGVIMNTTIKKNTDSLLANLT